MSSHELELLGWASDGVSVFWVFLLGMAWGKGVLSFLTMLLNSMFYLFRTLLYDGLHLSDMALFS